MRINHNLPALNTYNNLGATGTQQAKSMEKLSSGLRINRAGDDAAGLAISEKMRSQVRGLDQAGRNAQDGISLIQTAEGALNETHSILQRVRELAVQANNGTNTSSETDKIQQEIGELVTEVDKISERTEFNSQKLLNGNLGAASATASTDINGGATSVLKIADVTGAAVGTGYALAVTGTTIELTSADSSVVQTITVDDTTAMAKGTVLNFDKVGVKLEVTGATATTNIAAADTDTFDVSSSGIKLQIGANANQDLAVSINAMGSDVLGSAALKLDALNVRDFATAGLTFQDQLGAIDEAISTVSTERSKLGAYQNRLEHTITNLNTSSENLTAAESRIRDVDMAKEMMTMTKTNILSQAAQSMLAQANQAPQGILQLLRG